MDFVEDDRMNSEYISKIRDLSTRRDLFSEEGFSALTSLFEAVSGEPPAVYADRFRADHCQWLQLLDDFEHKHQLLKRTEDRQSYLFNSYALPLVETERAGQLLDTMEKIYQNLRELYRVHLKVPIEAVKLLESMNGYDLDKKENKEMLLEALYYLSDLNGVFSAKTVDFPYTEKSVISIAEGVLEDETIGDIIMKFYLHYEHMNSPLSQNSSMYLGSSEANLVGGSTSNLEISPVQPGIIGNVKWALENWRGLLKPRNALVCVIGIVFLFILSMIL